MRYDMHEHKYNVLIYILFWIHLFRYACLYLIPIADCVLQTMQRGEIRRQRGIDGSGCGDFMMVICCPFCALVQDAQEAEELKRHSAALRGQVIPGGAVVVTTTTGYVAPPAQQMNPPPGQQYPAQQYQQPPPQYDEKSQCMTRQWWFNKHAWTKQLLYMQYNT